MSCNGDVYCEMVKKQNEKLDDQLKKLKERNSTDFQRTKYENKTISTYSFVNSALLWVFYLVVLVVAVLIFRTSAVGLYAKVAIIVAFLIYPFIVNSAERILYKLLSYSYALMSGTVYVPPPF